MAQGMDVAGLVLAAGRSSRMGEPKALLDLNGRTFIETAIAALRDGGCDPVLAVVVASDPAARIAAAAGAVVVEGEPRGEQIDSLRRGLDAVEDAAAVAVLPVDHPRVRAATVAVLLDAWRADPESLVRPVHDGAAGHPTIFPRRVWPSLRDPDLPEGARSVVGTERKTDVPVDDRGVLIDIDTPEAYRRHGSSPA